METVKVNRKGHPCNPVTVNKEDMLKDDVIVGDEPKKEPVKEPKKKEQKKSK